LRRVDAAHRKTERVGQAGFTDSMTVLRQSRENLGVVNSVDTVRVHESTLQRSRRPSGGILHRNTTITDAPGVRTTGRFKCGHGDAPS
jgi:hypothetical protein